MTNQASKLSPPTLHWGKTGPDATKCDLCPATIKPYADCFISIRRAFEIQNGRIVVEVEPIRVLMCVDCGWTRPYAPVPREGAMAPEAPKVPQNGAQTSDGPSGEGPPDA